MFFFLFKCMATVVLLFYKPDKILHCTSICVSLGWLCEIQYASLFAPYFIVSSRVGTEIIIMDVRFGV